MKPTLTNPHDRFFARIFSDKQNAVDFLSHYLPREVLRLVDLESVEIAKDSFVDEKLRGSLSDMLYRVRIAGKPAYIYLLFEHKSYSDPLIGFQLLKYRIQIWDLHLRQHGGKRLPLIVPLVVYHGVKRWKGGESFGHIVSCPHEDLRAFVPDFRFLLYDLSGYSDEEIQGEVLLRVSLLVLKYVFRDELREKLESISGLLRELAGKKSGIGYLEVVIRYLFEGAEKLGREDIFEVFSKIEEGERLMPTIAQQLREEGRQEGRQEGRREGRQEGRQEGFMYARQILIEDLEEQFGAIPRTLADRIGRIEDFEALRELRRRRKGCGSAADFERLLDDALR